MGKTRKQLTKAQEWARKRNWAKRRLMGARAHLEAIAEDFAIVTSWEHMRLENAVAILDVALNYWDKSNPASKEGFCGKA